MSLEGAFMSPSNGRKTSNFFPSGGDVHGKGNNSSSGESFLDHESSVNSVMDFSMFVNGKDTPHLGSSRGATGAIDPLKGFGMGNDIGKLGLDLDFGLEQGMDFEPRVLADNNMDYINIGGLSLGPSLRGTSSSYSIWSEKPRDGLVFSPFIDHNFSPQVPVPQTSGGLFKKDGGSGSDVKTRNTGNTSVTPYENIYLAKVNKPKFVPHESPKQSRTASSSVGNQLVVKLPTSSRETPRCPKFHDYFLRENNDINHEDYCSTFYKRNSLGYMFIKEPSNTLKVNNSGPRSWVQLKIKFPYSANTRKLKVDIKLLPFWKPINLNIKDSSKTKRIVKDKRKYNVLKRFNRYNKADG